MNISKIKSNLSDLFTYWFALFAIIAVILFWNCCPPLNQGNLPKVNAEISRVDNDYQLKKNNLISGYNNIVIAAKKSNKQININSLQKNFDIISNNDSPSMFTTSYEDAYENVLQKVKQRIIKNVLKVNNNVLNKVKADSGLKPVIDKNDNKILQQGKKKFIENATCDILPRLFWSIIVFLAVSTIMLYIGGYLQFGL